MVMGEKVGKTRKTGKCMDQPAIKFLADKVMDHFHGAENRSLGRWILHRISHAESMLYMANLR
jgi:hypothetical protein